MDREIFLLPTRIDSAKFRPMKGDAMKKIIFFLFLIIFLSGGLSFLRPAFAADVAIAAGNFHSLALGGGTVWAWGELHIKTVDNFGTKVSGAPSEA